MDFNLLEVGAVVGIQLAAIIYGYGRLSQKVDGNQTNANVKFEQIETEIRELKEEVKATNNRLWGFRGGH